MHRLFWPVLCLLCLIFGAYVGVMYAKHVPKKCAAVEGMTPISSTADTCLYIRAWGMATTRRKAI